MAFTSTIFSKTLIGAAAALTLMSAQAAPVSLSYSGHGTSSWWTAAKATGTGSFETNSGQFSGDISYTDLKSFSFHLQIELDGVTENFFYGLDQLSNFWATVDNSGFTNFYLRTEYVRGDQRGGQGLNFEGLGADEARTHHFDIPGPFTIGQLKATFGPDNHVPEPATLALTLAALGLAGVVGRGRRSSQGKA
ncbi:MULTISPECIES: PEP-CTERM sorting domain-containing protein [Roseateles]|nr:MULTISPECIES: PEP-CTERM sorting domain-containing protein [Roseateles]